MIDFSLSPARNIPGIRVILLSENLYYDVEAYVPRSKVLGALVRMVHEEAGVSA